MARRPIFVPNLSGFPFVEEILVEFDWYPGFSKSQAQKSIASLHRVAAAEQNIPHVLEISSKSPNPLGVALSAFNLMLESAENREISVECAFQGSKVFERGGPYTDLYSASSRKAKIDERLRNSGNLVAFNFLGEDFPTHPVTAFYDWLYIIALQQHAKLAQELQAFQGFSDIVFNPKRSANCQARSAALFVSLHHRGIIERIVQDKDYFVHLMTGENSQILSATQTAHQLSLL